MGLLERVLERIAAESWASDEERDRFAAALGLCFERARSAHPDIIVPEELFVERVARSIARRMPVSAAAVASIRAEDVLLALGCEVGDAVALRKLDRLCLVPAGEFLERRGLASGADDAIQDLRVRLLSPEQGEPRITRYDGFGPLARWIQVAAVRTALNARRGERAEQPGHAELLERLSSSETDPEVHALRERHRGQLRCALEAALAALDPEARTLLRFHLVDGLSLGELSGIFGVHKSTLSRRVRSVQQAVLDLVRRSLIAEGIGADEIDSLWRALETDFELSVDRLLASDDGR